LKARDQLVRNGSGPLLAAGRLPKHYCLEVASDKTVCDSCQVPLRRQRSSPHHPVGLMLGQPRVRHVQKQCPACGQVYGSEAYRQLVPPHGNYAFDLIVEVGLARFLQHRQNREIQEELNERWRLHLPLSTINELAHAFLDYLAATHQAHAPQLRKRLQEDGGYCLHVDGTCEAGTETLFNAVAGNRGWTLTGCKMASEDAAQITQLLRRCVEWFGLPLALVRDLSSSIEIAKKQVLPNIPDMICQYHFLENVGTKLCEKLHTKLTACLRRSKIRPALRSLRCDLVRYSKQRAPFSAAQIEQLLQAPKQAANVDPVQLRRLLAYLPLRWLEDYGADLQGEYFPFDLPNLAFYRRCRILDSWLAEVVDATDFPRQTLSTLATIKRHLAPVREDAKFVAAAERLEKAETLFNELRDVLRLSNDPNRPLLRQRAPANEPAVAQETEQHLQQWMDGLRQRLASEPDADKAADTQTVLKYLEKYHDNLVGHVIVLPAQTAPFVVERTNNVSERRFGSTKQGLRRKVGTKNLARHIQAMRSEEFLVANLDDPDYVDTLFGGKLENLAASFANHWHAGKTIRTERRKRGSWWKLMGSFWFEVKFAAVE
jgi:hypothetical protein